jgi:hypothetical protein
MPLSVAVAVADTGRNNNNQGPNESPVDLGLSPLQTPLPLPMVVMLLQSLLPREKQSKANNLRLQAIGLFIIIKHKHIITLYYNSFFFLCFVACRTR